LSTILQSFHLSFELNDFRIYRQIFYAARIFFANFLTADFKFLLRSNITVTYRYSPKWENKTVAISNYKTQHGFSVSAVIKTNPTTFEFNKIHVSRKILSKILYLSNSQHNSNCYKWRQCSICG
jgi:hypothetical protein